MNAQCLMKHAMSPRSMTPSTRICSVVAQALRDSVRHYQRWRASVSDEEFTSPTEKVKGQIEGLRRRLDDNRGGGNG